MKKIMLYPYDISNLHLLQYQDANAQLYKVAYVVSPRGWGYTGEDAGKKVGIETNYIVKDQFEYNLKKSDVLMIIDSRICLEDSEIEKYIKIASDMGKEVILLKEINEEIIKKYHESIIDIRSIDSKLKMDLKLKEQDNIIYDIKKPIVLVLGTGEQCYKFTTQILLREIFKANGYNVTQIGTKDDSYYYGFHPFPQFMLKNQISDKDKIIYFNHYVKALSENEESDVIIIGVPGGIEKYDNKYLNDFGVLNYLVSNAISPDFVVFNSMYVDYPEKYFPLINNSLKYKYNYALDAIFLTNSMVNWDATEDFQKLVYLTLDNNFVHETAKQFNVYTLFNEGDRKRFEQHILSTLEGYGKYEEF